MNDIINIDLEKAGFTQEEMTAYWEKKTTESLTPKIILAQAEADKRV